MRRITYIIAVFLGLAAVAGMAAALNPLKGDDWNLDPDGDGLINVDEFIAGSDPNNYDTDGDGLPDGWEVKNSLDPADPADAALDNDYFGGEEYSLYSEVDPPYDNFAEYYRFYGIDPNTGETIYLHTDPNDPDSDGDRILDPDDAYPLGYFPPPPPPPPDPIDPDSGGEGNGPAQGGDGDGDGNIDDDGDGITDTDEMAMGTDFNNPDTDGDGLWDNMELALGLDPNDWDTDNDMLIDGVERGGSDSTDGHLTDTDNDGTPGSGNGGADKSYDRDKNEPQADTDNDGLMDRYEMSIGTDYLNPDTDGDGLIDSMEVSIGTDPNDWDTDNDMLIDGVEVGSGYSTDGHLSDTDNDGIQ